MPCGELFIDQLARRTGVRCGGEIACNDDSNFELQSELILEVSGCEKLLIAVDGHGPEDFGPFVLTGDEATAKSQASISPTPPPTAEPWTRAIDGLGKS